MHRRIISRRGEKARKIPPRGESKYLKNWRYILIFLFNICYNLIASEYWKTERRIILRRYHLSLYGVPIMDEEIIKQFLLFINSLTRCIPCVYQNSFLRLPYNPKMNILIIRFWKVFESILTRHRECNDAFSWIWYPFHDRTCHRDILWCFGRIHNWYNHRDRWFRGIPSEYISSKLTKSWIHRCPHITFYLNLSDDIGFILTYLVSVFFFDNHITWPFYTSYHKESSSDPDCESNSDDDEKYIHTIIVYVCRKIAKEKLRKIPPKWDFIDISTSSI